MRAVEIPQIQFGWTAISDGLFNEFCTVLHNCLFEPSSRPQLRSGKTRNMRNFSCNILFFFDARTENLEMKRQLPRAGNYVSHNQKEIEKIFCSKTATLLLLCISLLDFESASCFRPRLTADGDVGFQIAEGVATRELRDHRYDL